MDKPSGLGTQYGAQFQDAAIVAAYGYRPPYPDETFVILDSLIVDEPRNVLDAGCGRGEIARRLLPLVERVDAVDASAGMIAAGKGLPGGDDPRLHWQHALMEQARLDPPYALITAGSSLHWMDWGVVMPMFAAALSPNGALALVGEDGPLYPWSKERLVIINRYSTNHDYQPYNLFDELAKRGLFYEQGRKTTALQPFRQSVADFIAGDHSRNGLSRDRMSAAAAAAFDREMTDLLTPYAADGALSLRIAATVVWGRPAGVKTD